ncbi:unnamed protein product [Macrosiphum euphorbiae]|uniref:Uncharacterized protein n=1 Tax=Macrosiphum euphorbiae TaxID=13131 RepID=A0AAV0VUL5_9HEMI|nr:unnamed protein product [Macrosiphum euphorbiae]
MYSCGFNVYVDSCAEWCNCSPTEYLLKKWLSREFRDWTFTEADSIGMTIGHVSGLLVVLGLSVVVAAVMFAELVTAGANRSVDQVPFRNVIDRCNSTGAAVV